VPVALSDNELADVERSKLKKRWMDKVNGALRSIPRFETPQERADHRLKVDNRSRSAKDVPNARTDRCQRCYGAGHVFTDCEVSPDGPPFVILTQRYQSDLSASDGTNLYMSNARWCRLCQLYGHYAEECRVCTLCGRHGHLATHCGSGFHWWSYGCNAAIKLCKLNFRFDVIDILILTFEMLMFSAMHMPDARLLLVFCTF
jgi:hypothetical protein